MTTAARLTAALRNGPLTAPELAEAIGAKLATVQQTLSRNGEFVRIDLRGSRSKRDSSRWDLVSSGAAAPLPDGCRITHTIGRGHTEEHVRTIPVILVPSPEGFDCSRKGHHVTYAHCLDEYVTAESGFRRARTVCNHCPVGAKLRADYAEPIDDIEEEQPHGF